LKKNKKGDGKKPPTTLRGGKDNSMSYKIRIQRVGLRARRLPKKKKKKGWQGTLGYERELGQS